MGITKDEETLVFNHLSLIDMERVEKSLLKLKETDDPYLKEVLFRDAVIKWTSQGLLDTK